MSSSIMVLRSENEPLLDLESRILELEILSRKADSSGLLRKLQEMVPTFRPDAAHGLAGSGVAA